MSKINHGKGNLLNLVDAGAYHRILKPGETMANTWGTLELGAFLHPDLTRFPVYNATEMNVIYRQQHWKGQLLPDAGTCCVPFNGTSQILLGRICGIAFFWWKPSPNESAL